MGSYQIMPLARLPVSQAIIAILHCCVFVPTLQTVVVSSELQQWLCHKQWVPIVVLEKVALINATGHVDQPPKRSVCKRA